MVEFDQLPPTSRSLILATLALDITTINCRNIFDLALRRNQTVQEVWRDICKRTAQPRCTMPRAVLESRYTAAPGARTTAAPTAPVGRPMTAASVMEFGDLIAITPAAPSAPPVSVDPPAPQPTAAPAPKRRPAAMHVPAAPKRWAVITSAGAFLVLAIAILLVGTMTRATQTARFDEPVSIRAAHEPMRESMRAAGSKSGAGPVAGPEGTVRRMDAISKSFSKR